MAVEQKDFVIPSSEEDRKKIRDRFVEVSAAKTRILGERDLIKVIIGDLSEEYDIPKRVLSKMANAFHNDSFDTVAAEADFLESARILILKEQVI